MFIISEYAVCVLAVWIGMTLLFIPCVMFLVLIEGCSILPQILRKRTHGDIPLIGRRTAVEPREP
jgi:hypothetical protein